MNGEFIEGINENFSLLLKVTSILNLSVITSSFELKILLLESFILNFVNEESGFNNKTFLKIKFNKKQKLNNNFIFILFIYILKK